MHHDHQMILIVKSLKVEQTETHVLDYLNYHFKQYSIAKPSDDSHEDDDNTYDIEISNIWHM